MTEKETRTMAFYGKGGIGKSTVCSNLAITFSEMDNKVFQIGCSPKIDSTSYLNGGEVLDLNILEHTRDNGQSVDVVKECICEGYKGILCAESGGPEPAKGCAGKGVKIAIELLSEYNLFEWTRANVVLFDVIGDVVCGGFAQPIRAGFAKELYIVSSGELMSLYSANNICIAIKAAIEEGSDIRIGGIIGNMRGVPMEEEVLEQFGKTLGLPILSYIPRDSIVQAAEGEGGTVLEKRPDSEQGRCYRDLGKNIMQLEKSDFCVPTPVELEDLVDMLREYQEKDYQIA